MITFKMPDSSCSDIVKLRPITNGSIVLCREDDLAYDKSHHTHIFINKRKIWSVYYYRFNDVHGFCIERSGISMEMLENDFELFFGHYEVV